MREGIVSFQRRDQHYARFVADVTEVMYHPNPNQAGSSA